jgi:formylmethanofuran dehydrogenase subunit E
MLSLDDLIREAEIAHGHLCAGQVLGVRLAMLGLAKLGIEDPRGKDRKRLVTFVEIDRCATDAIGVVTGCRLGKRALKFRDWGKMAATFVDLSSHVESAHPGFGVAQRLSAAMDGALATTASAAEGQPPVSRDPFLKSAEGAPLKPAFSLSGFASGHWYRAIRIAAKESSKKLARELHPEIGNKNQQQMLAYREMSDDDLFSTEWVKVELPPEEFPGYKSDRIVCAQCGEGINFHRHVERGGRVLCRACAGESYYEPL